MLEKKLTHNVDMFAARSSGSNIKTKALCGALVIASEISKDWENPTCDRCQKLRKLYKHIRV